MAHFAEIDTDNIVLRVLVVSDGDEHRGQEFLADDMGLGGTWIKTSYNTWGGVHHNSGGVPDDETPVRANYASVGSIYNPDNDVFHRPEPSEGDWTLNAETWLWEEVT